MTITKKLLTTSATVLAMSGMLLMSTPASAGFFDWFSATPLNQEAQSIKATSQNDFLSKEVRMVDIKAVDAKALEVRKRSAFSNFFTNIFGGGSSCGSDQSITLLAPNNGSYNAGDTMNVKWESCNMSASTQIFIQLRPQNGGNSYNIISAEYPVNPNDGIQSIEIPVNVNEGYYKVRIGHSTLNHPATITDDYSDEIVEIINNSDLSEVEEEVQVSSSQNCNANTTPWIEVLTPNGGEVYANTDDLTVKWESCNLNSNTTLAVEMMNETDGLMVAFVPNTGIHTFQLSANSIENPSTTPSNPVQYGAHFKVHIGTPPTVFPSYYDQSDNVFKIYEESVPVVVPSPTPISIDTCGLEVLVPSANVQYDVPENYQGKITVLARFGASTGPTSCNWSYFEGNAGVVKLVSDGLVITEGYLSYLTSDGDLMNTYMDTPLYVSADLIFPSNTVDGSINFELKFVENDPSGMSQDSFSIPIDIDVY